MGSPQLQADTRLECLQVLALPVHVGLAVFAICVFVVMRGHVPVFPVAWAAAKLLGIMLPGFAFLNFVRVAYNSPRIVIDESLLAIYTGGGDTPRWRFPLPEVFWKSLPDGTIALYPFSLLDSFRSLGMKPYRLRPVLHPDAVKDLRNLLQRCNSKTKG